jgi:hypothetical protein
MKKKLLTEQTLTETKGYNGLMKAYQAVDKKAEKYKKLKQLLWINHHFVLMRQ